MLNLWFPLMTAALLATTAAGSLLWSSHWYTYVPKPVRDHQDSRQFREGGGFLRIIRGYEAHDTEGNSLGTVRPLHGCMGAIKWTTLILLPTYAVGSLIWIVFPSSTVHVAVLYGVIIMIVMTIVFPALVVSIGGIPGQFSFSDMPETPAAWGALLSLYGGAVVAKFVFGVNIVQVILSSPVAEPWATLGTAGIPVAFFAIFWTLLNQMLPSSVPWPTRVVFLGACAIYFIVTEMFVVLLLVC